MKKQFLFAVLATAVAAAGCSKDEVTTRAEFSDGNAIGFKTYVPKATRGAAIENEAGLQKTDFDVFAFTGNNQFMGASAADGVKIAYKESKWDYNVPAEQAYWPASDTKIDFYAVSPETATGLTKNFTSAKQELTYTVSTVAAQQCDLMYAEKKNVSKGDRDGDGTNVSTGGVKLQFNHTLSQIVFKAKAAVAGYSVDVESVTIHNLTKSGTFAYDTKNWTLTTTGNNIREKYAADITVPKTGIVNTAQDLTTSSNALLLLPQTTTKWDVEGNTKTIAQADNAGQTYISISCKITHNNVYIVGSQEAYATIYIPFAANWNQSNKYTYTIVFCDPDGSNGYDKDGNESSELISFVPSVQSWTNQSGEDITL